MVNVRTVRFHKPRNGLAAKINLHAAVQKGNFWMEINVSRATGIITRTHSALKTAQDAQVCQHRPRDPPENWIAVNVRMVLGGMQKPGSVTCVNLVSEGCRVDASLVLVENIRIKVAEQAANIASQTAQTMNTGTHKLIVAGGPLVVTPVLKIRYHSRGRIGFYETAIASLGTSLKQIFLVAPSAAWARTGNIHKTHRLVCHVPRIRPRTPKLPPAN